LNAENPFKTYLNFRNNLTLLKKNLSFWHALAVIPIRFCMDLLAIFRFLNEGKRRDAWAVSRAHQYFVVHLFKKVRKSGSPEVRKTEEVGSRKSANATANSSLKGMYKRSLVWDFFVKKKRHFTDLDQADFL
jgi:hypothetical protein